MLSICAAVSRACSSSLVGWRRSGGVTLPVGDAGVATLTATAEGMAQVVWLSSESSTSVTNEKGNKMAGYEEGRPSRWDKVGMMDG